MCVSGWVVWGVCFGGGVLSVPNAHRTRLPHVLCVKHIHIDTSTECFSSVKEYHFCASIHTRIRSVRMQKLTARGRV